MGSILGLGRSPGGGHGNPLQYSCLENPKDRGAWRATVNRGTQSQTWLEQLSTCTHTFELKLGLTSSSLLLVKTSWGVVFSNGVIRDFWHSVEFSSVPQSCPTLCDPVDGSPPRSSIPGILQARTLEWVAVSFSNALKWKVKVKLLSCVQLFVTQWTIAYQAPPSMGFSRQEYWSGVPLPSPKSISGML